MKEATPKEQCPHCGKWLTRPSRIGYRLRKHKCSPEHVRAEQEARAAMRPWDKVR